MKTSPDGIDFICAEEGLRLEAYRDVVGVLTIGYGHTGADVKDGQTITKDQAEALLAADLVKFEKAVDTAVRNPSQGQFDAMVSLAFNIGVAAFRSSTLVRKFNQGDHRGAGCEFVKWCRAGGAVNTTLQGRRAREMWTFCKATP